MNKQYEHIFFDLDHTLWDFEANSREVILTLYKLFDLKGKGVECDETFFEKFTHQNHRLWEKYRKGEIKQEELRWKRFWSVMLDYRIAEEKLAREMSAEYVQQLPLQDKLLPYAVDVLNYCTQKGYKLHIITNGFEEVQYKKMQTSDIGHYFIEVITSERSMSLKPQREIFDYAIHSTGATVNNSLMIGDSWDADIIGAMNYGMDQVFYNPQSFAYDKKPTFDIRCLSELKVII